MPYGPRNSNGFAMITSPSKLCMKHKPTPDLTVFSPLLVKELRGQDTLGCHGWSRPIPHSFCDFFQFDSAGRIKRNTSEGIMKKLESSSGEWLNRPLYPFLLSHGTFPQHSPIITPRHHLLCTIASFSSETRLCLKVHLRPAVLQLRVTWSIHVICCVSNVIMLCTPNQQMKEIYSPTFIDTAVSLTTTLISTRVCQQEKEAGPMAYSAVWWVALISGVRVFMYTL